MYIHERKEWPHFTWDQERLTAAMGGLHQRHGRLQGLFDALGFSPQAEASLAALSMDALRSAEIEGERLDVQEVRSSVARRLGLDIADPVPASREAEAMVDLTLDAIRGCREPLTRERLFGWHACLFPGGRSGLFRIRTGAWRDDAQGPMQVVSGGMGRERVHFQAPEASRLPEEMERFCAWFESETGMDPVLHAAVAHLWFLTLHPFDDGNGRLARALTDLRLARMEGGTVRFYSLSAGILAKRKEYYRILEATQSGDLDITLWLEWFLACMDHALEMAESTVAGVLRRHRFWQRHQAFICNARQRKVLGLLLERFEGKLTNRTWAKLGCCSSDTALRDLQALVKAGILAQEEAGGRSTAYRLVEPDQSSAALAAP